MPEPQFPMMIVINESAANGSTETFPRPMHCRDCDKVFPFSPEFGPDLTPERRAACVGWGSYFTEPRIDRAMSAVEYVLCPDCLAAADWQSDPAG